CGFCGRQGCKTWAPLKGKKAPQVRSSCFLAQKADSRSQDVTSNFKSAVKFNKSAPSTNVPMQCIWCEPPVWEWKYSLEFHVKSRHSK
ncbi:unnamed protein product, partial [Hapterophycus canaliculatus]